MGFFSELKEDLSQAVNELLPVEEKEVTESASDIAAQTAATTQEDFADQVSLEDMLEKLDHMQLPQMDTEAVEKEADLPETSGMPQTEDLPEAGDVAETEALPETGVMAETAEAPEEDIVEAERPEEGIAEAIEVPETADTTMTEDGPAEAETEYPGIPDPQIREHRITEESKGAGRHMEGLTNREAADETAVITAGMKIHGDIESEGSMDVIGTVEGNIDILGKLNITGHINGNSKAAEVYAEGAKITGEIVSDGAVKIGDSSVIIGNIIAKSAAIAGAVKGDIDVQGPVILDSSAIVMGNIKSKSVQINNGAVIEGMCSQCYADVSPVSFFEGL